MPEGSFLGLDRPFVEETEKPLIVVIFFSKIHSTQELRDIAQILIGRMENEHGIAISEADVDKGPENDFINIFLVSVSIDHKNIERIREESMEKKGFKRMRISTVPSDQLVSP